MKIVPHFRDSSSDVVTAASAAVDLLKNAEVLAIFGPQMSTQAYFVVDIGDKVGVPILSPATSPALSPHRSPYFARSAWCVSSQAEAIAAVVKTFGWREVVLVYEDSIYGSGLVPFLTENLLQSNVLLSYQSVAPAAAGNDQHLRKLKATGARVFVVHVLPAVASRLFQMAKEEGMMEEGYAWLITDVLTSVLDSVDSETIEAMQGVVGVKAYIPASNKLSKFTRRWSMRFHQENPDMDRTQLNVFGLWAYDSITALANVVERVGMASPRFKKPVHIVNMTDMETIGTSNAGPSLVRLIRNYKSKGLSGDFNVTNGQLQPSAFEIVNTFGKGGNRVGFWTKNNGISKQLKPVDSGKDNLGGILWPGQTSDVPKGWEIPTGGNKLKVLVPKRTRSKKLSKLEGMQRQTLWKHQVSELMFSNKSWDQCHMSLIFLRYLMTCLLWDAFLKLLFDGEPKYDALVADTTITAKRSEIVDFSFPYTESGVATIVPIKDNGRKNAWIFMKPLTAGLWLTIGAFFVFTGLVVWVLEHRENEEFQGPPLQQVGKMFWFTFSTLVFAHREKLMSNLTRFVMIVWVFVVLVLKSSYTASLTSMLTVQQLQPTITDIHDLIKSGEYIGYQRGSFVTDLLKEMKFDSSMFRSYRTLEEYDEALSKGSRNGGVGAIVDELPYIRLFLSKYCHKYTMIGPTYPTSGFGFIFPKGSPLVAGVSRAILKLKESEEMMRISSKWFKQGCPAGNGDGTMTVSDRLDVDSFRGLFLIAGLSSASALAMFFLFDNRFVLTSTALALKQKLCFLSGVLCQVAASLKESSGVSGETEIPAICTECDQQGMA